MKPVTLAFALAGAILALPAQANDALAKKHQCLACHQTATKLVGPSYKEIAAKYKADKSAEAKLYDKVKKGGGGVWGPVPMPPNPNVPDADLKALVKWVLATK